MAAPGIRVTRPKVIGPPTLPPTFSPTATTEPAIDLDALWGKVQQTSAELGPPPSKPGWGEWAAGAVSEGWSRIKPWLQPGPGQPPEGTLPPIEGGEPQSAQPDLEATKTDLFAERDALTEEAAGLRAYQGYPDYQQRLGEFQRRLGDHQQRMAAFKARVEQMPTPTEPPQSPAVEGIKRRGEVALGGFKGGMQQLISEPRKALEATSALVQSYGDPVMEAALRGMPQAGTAGLPSSIAREIPTRPATQTELTDLAERTKESPLTQAIRKPLEVAAEPLRVAERFWQPGAAEAPQGLEEMVWAGLGGSPVMLAQLMLTRKIMPTLTLPSKFANVSPDLMRTPAVQQAIRQAQEIGRTVSAMATLGVARPAVEGKGGVEAAKGFGLGTAAGSAFAALPYLPRAIQGPAIFSVGAAQSALEGGSVEDATASGLTLAILHALMPGGRPPVSQGAGAEPAGAAPTERLQLPPGVSRVGGPAPEGPAPGPLPLRGGPYRALPMPPPARPQPGPRPPIPIERGAIPQWEVAPKMGQRIVQLLKDGLAPNQVVDTLTREGWPPDAIGMPGMEQTIREASRVLNPTRAPEPATPVAMAPVAPAPTAAPSAAPVAQEVPASVAPVPESAASVVDVTANPNYQNLIDALVGIGFKRKEAQAVANETVRANPDADFDTLFRAAMAPIADRKAKRTEYPAQPPAPQPPPLAVAPAVEPAAGEPSVEVVQPVEPEVPATPEIPPVAAQEAVSAPITTEPAAEVLVQPGPTEPPAPPSEPTPVPLLGPVGVTAEARMPSGVPIEFQYRWVDENSLIASHDANFRENPVYPQEIQPRDRDRVGLRDQVNRIRTLLNPDEVAENPLLEHGAPVVGPDRAVESGNGRVLGIRRSTPERRQAYLQYIVNNATKFGLNPDEVAANPKGILVRERITPVPDRVRYAEDLNAARTARLGALDQTKVDARRLSDAILAEFKEGGEKQSADQILLGQKPWLAGALREIVPRAEWDTVIDQAGNIAPAGLQRIKAAIFQKAYDPQGPLTSLLVETTDPGIKNILTGLLNAAPAVTRAEGRIRQGEVDAQPIGQDLATAAEMFASLRNDPDIVLKKASAPAEQPGYATYSDYSEAQPDMFGGLTPRQTAFMREIEARAGSAKQIREFVQGLVEPILRAPHKDQGILFMRPLRSHLYEGFDETLADRAMAQLGTTDDPYDALFITRDGMQLAGASGHVPHERHATGILRKDTEQSSQRDLSDLMLRTGFIRVAGPHDYSFETLPTPDQIRTIVRNARRIDPQMGLILEANDPRFPGEYQIVAHEEIAQPTVEAVQQFLEKVADIHKMLGLLDRGEGQTSAVAYAKGRERTLASLDPTIFDLARYQKILDTAPPIAGRPDLKVLDTGEALDVARTASVAAHPTVAPYARAVEIAFRRIVERLGPENAALEEVRFGGIALGREYLGLYLRSSWIDRTLGDTIYVNPAMIAYEVSRQVYQGEITLAEAGEQFAQQTVAVLIHEATHPQSAEHSEAFASAETWNFGRMIGDVAQIADAVKTMGGTDAAYRYFLGQYPALQTAWAERANLLGTVSSGAPAPSAGSAGPGAPLGSGAAGVRPLPDLLHRGQVPTRRVAARPPIPRRGTVGPDLDTALDRATFDTRLTPPGQIGHAGIIKNGRLTAWHVTENPDVVTSQLKAGTRPDQARQGGDLGGGLYFSIIPQIWRGRGRQGVYEAIKNLPAEKRQAFVDTMRAENQHTFSPGYLTESERTNVEYHLQQFVQRGGEEMIAGVAGQPYNMDPERALKAIGEGFHEPATVDVEVQGQFLDWGALSSEQVTSLEAAAHQWLTEEGYYDERGKITSQGLAVIRQFGNERDLTNEYLRSLGYDGAIRPGHMMEIGQGVVWNLNAIRKFGDWHNARPSPGVAGEGSYYPPAPEHVRLFSADGERFTPDLDTAREALSRRDPRAVIRFVDVPTTVAVLGSETLPAEWSSRARPLWSRGRDLAAIDPLVDLEPWGSRATDTEPDLPFRTRMRALWSQFDQGALGLREQTEAQQTVRRDAAKAILRVNPVIVGTTLTDGRGYVLIHAGASASEPFRLTQFDARGLSGHEVHRTPTEALVNAIRDGYLDAVPPNTLDRIMRSPDGQQSIDIQAVRDFTNELSLEQNPTWSSFIKLPFEVQLRVVRDPELREAMRGGAVPEELARYQPPEQLILTPPAVRPKPLPAPEQQELFPSTAVARRMPTERLRPTKPQAQGDLLARLRPPVVSQELPTPPPRRESRTEPGVELGFFLGVPRLTANQAETLRQAMRAVFTRAGQREAIGATGNATHELQARAAKGGWYSLEGYLKSLGSEPALELESALKNTWADYYRFAAHLWKDIGPTEKRTRPFLQNLYDVLKGEAQPINETVREAYRVMLTIIHPDTGLIPVGTRNRDIRGFTGPGGVGGEERPFTPRRGDLMPRIYPEHYQDACLTPGSPERTEALAHLVATGQAQSEAAAAELLDRTFGRARERRRAGGGAREAWAPGLTMPREIDLPGHLKDPYVALAIRVDQAAKRWSQVDNLGTKYHRVFGDSDAGTAGWLDRIGGAHGDMAQEATEFLFNVAYGGHYDHGLVGKILGGIQNYESATKLPLAFIQNLGQNSMAGIMAGLRPWLQATAERAGLLGPGGKRRAREASRLVGVTFRQAIRDLETQAGLAGNAPLSGITRRILHVWKWSEADINRTITPRTGQIALQQIDRQLRSGRQLSTASRGLLRQIGVDPTAAAERGGLTQEQIEHGMWRIMDETQFIERPSAMPGLFDPRGPLGAWGPFIFQWKNFAVRLNRFLWWGTVQEARQGNWRPLARLMLVAPAIGELVGAARAAIAGRERRWLPEEEGAWDVVKHYVTNIPEAYGLGVLASIIESMGYGVASTAKAIAGPGLSQVTSALVNAARGAQTAWAAWGGTQSDQEAMERWLRDAGRAALREVPLLGRPLGSRPMAYTEGELLNRFTAEYQDAMRRAAEFRAQALQSGGSTAQEYLRKERRTLDDFNRKYRDTPGFVPITQPSPDAVRRALERTRRPPAERARERLPKIQRGIQPGASLREGLMPPPLAALAAEVERTALAAHLETVPPERRRQMDALLRYVQRAQPRGVGA